MPTLDWLNRAQAFATAAPMPYWLLEEVSVHTAAIQPGPAGAKLQEALVETSAGNGLLRAHGNLLLRVAWARLCKFALPCRVQTL